MVLGYIPVSLVLSLVSSAGGLARLAASLISLAASIIFIKASIRRYHDIGHSGWWLLVQATLYLASVITIAIAVASLPVSLVIGTSNSIHISSAIWTTFGIGGVVILATAIWGLVWLCIPGQDEPNRWG
jgi:uncharacterized membrane protein YhaH (DUF805 family)